MMSEQAKRARSLVGTSDGRPPNDFYPSPPIAVEKLLAVESFDGPIWEPACGDGAISRVLEAHGHEVISTDLYDYGYGASGIDFLTATPSIQCPNLITNPPYKLATEFVERALDVTTGKVAMLVKLSFLEGQKRKKLFEMSPLARVYVFSGRLTMYRNGEKGSYSSGMLAFAWAVWDKEHRGEPVLRWL